MVTFFVEKFGLYAYGHLVTKKAKYFSMKRLHEKKNGFYSIRKRCMPLMLYLNNHFVHVEPWKNLNRTLVVNIIYMV